MEMATWKGWNESEVRLSQKTAGQPTMETSVSSATLKAGTFSSALGRRSPPAPMVMGFTPINAPIATGRRTSNTANSKQQGHRKQAAAQVDELSSLPRSIASEYLGRGDGEAITPAAEHTTRVTRGSTAKKKSNVSKKRAATTNALPASKRRKTSDISDSMPVTMSKPSKSKAKPKSTKRKEADAAAETAETLSSQPVALFSSSTSMEALSMPSQQTSLDAVRASQGFGTTLYHGYQAPTTGPRFTVVARPWLESQKVGSQHDISPHLPSAVPLVHEAANDAENSSLQNQQQSKPSRQRMLSSRTISEDFMIGDDEGLEEAMVLADSLERRPKNAQNVKSAPKSKGSLQQSNSKRKARSQNKAQVQSSDPTVTSSRTLSETFIIGDDDDMTEALTAVEQLECSSSPQPGQLMSTAKRRNGPATGKENEAKRRKNSRLTRSEQVTEPPPMTEDESFEAGTSPVEEEAPQRSPTPPARQWKLNMREIDENEDYDGGLFSEAEKKILDSLKTNHENGLRPIVRTPFPRPILDPSPLFGASPTTALRTCFRIGEALTEGSAAVRSNHDTIIELYARAVASHREGRKQHFVFHDLYHDRPPYLEGVCELRNQTKLWELDTQSFLDAEKRQEGVMCRAIARMKRKEGADGKGKGWKLEVLSVWEAGWEDVEFVAGIYGKGRDEACGED